MPDLVAGSRIDAADWPPPGYAFDGSAIDNVSALSYTAGSPVVSFNFIAPTSGRVLLIVGLCAGDNTGVNRVQYAPEVFEGASAAGTRILAPDSGSRGVLSASTATNFGEWSRITLLEGLTPRALHFARGMYRVTAGATCDITFRDIGIRPVA